MIPICSLLEILVCKSVPLFILQYFFLLSWTLIFSGLSIDQAKVQMAIWSVLAAPLIMSNDLRTIRPEFLEILANPIAIRVNQAS